LSPGTSWSGKVKATTNKTAIATFLEVDGKSAESAS
jgi:hypothetical protein